MAREVFNYQSASDYYRDAGEEAQLKAMKDCGLIDDETDPDDIIYYARTPKFDPYERNQHSDYGFTYDDPDDDCITFPNGETFNILDVAGDESFWDEYENIIQERNIEKISENIENTERSNNMDEGMKKLMETSANMFSQKTAELSSTNPATVQSVDRSSVSGRRTIIANIEAEIKAKNPALAYNTIDKANANGKPRVAGIDLVKLQAENIFNEGYDSLLEYEKAKGGPGSLINIADNGRAIPVGQNAAIVPGVSGTGTAIIPNAQVVNGNITAAKPTPGDFKSPEIQAQTLPNQKQTAIPGVNAGLGVGVPVNVKNLMLSTGTVSNVNTNSTPAWVEKSTTTAAANISAEATNQTVQQPIPPQPTITQPPIQEQVTPVQQPGSVNVTTENIPFMKQEVKDQWDRQSIKDIDNQIDLLQKNGYIAEVQNKKVFKGIDVNKLVEARKELDTPRLATARMSYRKLERDLAICVLDSGIPEDKIDILMELFNAIGVGESFALAVEQIAYERSNSNLPMRGRLEAKYNPLDIYGQVTKHSEKTEPILTQEANRIMDVYKNDEFAFASIKKSQVLDVLEFINKNGLFVNFTVDEAKVAYSELASSCLYNKFDKRSYENWKTIIYYVVGILGCQDTLLREYYVSTFGDTPENDTKLGGINMNNNTLRPAFGMGSIASVPGMITQPTIQTTQPNGTTVQTTQVAPGQAGTVQQPIQQVPSQQVQPGAGMVQAPTNPMMGTTGVVQQTTPQPIAPIQPTAGPVNMPAMGMVQQAQTYGGAQPTMPTQAQGIISNPTMNTTAGTVAMSNMAGTNQMQSTYQTQQQVMQQPAQNQQMVMAPTQPITQAQYTQPVVAQPNIQYTQQMQMQPAAQVGNQMMNQQINTNGGMNMNMMGQQNMMNGYNQMQGYGMNMGQMPNMMGNQMMNGMNMMGQQYTNPMIGRSPMPVAPTQINPMMNQQNMMNSYNPMMSQQNMYNQSVNPMMSQQYGNQMMNSSMMPMPNQFNARTPMANTTPMNPMMQNQMGYNGMYMNQTNPMMNPMMNRQNPMGMTTNPMMGNQMMNGYNGMNMYGQGNPMANQMNMYQNQMMNRTTMPIAAINPMMNQQNMMNSYNPMMMNQTQHMNPMMNSSMMNQTPLYNNGMNMMNSMYQNSMMNQANMNMYQNPMMNGYNQMQGYGYNGYGMNGMGF